MCMASIFQPSMARLGCRSGGSGVWTDWGLSTQLTPFPAAALTAAGPAPTRAGSWPWTPRVAATVCALRFPWWDGEGVWICWGQVFPGFAQISDILKC